MTNNSLTGADVKNLASADVANGRLLAEDFAPGQLPAGPPGKDGARGQDGAPGRDGAPGATDVVVRTQQGSDLPSGVHYLHVIQCQPGERATGGGAGFTGFVGNEVLRVSHPLESDGTIPEAGDVPTGWLAAIEYAGGGPRDPVGYVICASP